MDRSLRDLERIVRETPADDTAARALLRALAREKVPETLAPVPKLPLAALLAAFGAARGESTALLRVPEERFTGGAFLGPLLALEVEWLEDLEPDALDEDTSGLFWLKASEERAPALFAATLRVRLVLLERLARESPDTFATWCALHAALDLGGDDALESLVRVVATAIGRIAERAARLLASRPEPAVGLRLARLACEVPAEARPRIYSALEVGTVPIEREAQTHLKKAVKRELPGALRVKAYAALNRAATRSDLARDLADPEAPPEARANAFTALLPLSGTTEAHDLMRHALSDKDAAVRRAAVHLLGTQRWLRHARTVDWALGRLRDADRGVRHDAIRLLRRTGVPPRYLDKLRVIVASAPPGIRPILKRLLDQMEKS